MGMVESGGEEKILVSVRLRPLNDKEIERNDVCDWECANGDTIVYKNVNLSMPDRSMYPSAYTFDRVFRSDCSTNQVYEEGAKEVALQVVNGINATLFAYGQTSSGKTYTMSGITEYAIADVYNYMEKHNEREFHLKFSAMEIYNESVRDLLSADTTPLRLLDDPERGTVVEKLTEEPLRDWDHCMELLSICEAQRQIGETALNETSSRSHQIIRLTIDSSPREHSGKDNLSILSASVSFVDLAGSERASHSLSAGTRLKEGCHINRSLLTLGTVIRKLSKGRNGHIPFRDSKLTRILQSSLGGNARTVIICTMSPARIHVEQSRNTLFFASSAKEVTTNAQVNVILSDKELVKHLQKELARLESESRSLQSTFIPSHYTVLLRDKELHIEKLETEIVDLTMKLKAAQSRIQDLLRLFEEERDSMPEKEIIDLRMQQDVAQSQVKELLQPLGAERDAKAPFDYYSHLHVGDSPECENPISAATPFSIPNTCDIGVRTFDRSPYSYGQSESSSEDHYVQLPEFEENFRKNNRPPQYAVSTSIVNPSSSIHSWDEIEEQTDEITEVLCRDVRCIETVESNKSSPPENISGNENGIDHEFVSKPIKEGREFSYMLPLIDPSPEKPSLWPLNSYRCSSESFKLTKSRSCNAGFMMTPSSSWVDKVDGFENTPSNWFKKEFIGRPEVVQTKPCELTYAGGVAKLSRKGFQSSVESAANLELKAVDTTMSCENITNTIECDIKAEGELEHLLEKEIDNSPQLQREDLESKESSRRDVGLDPIEDDSKITPNWTSEFKRIQKEIIMLWGTCHVSLVHRTYFFLLFNGDPSDSIYMEVELRRLSFLENTFSQGSNTISEGRILSAASSMRALRRERAMLCRQMMKRLSEQERESLYLKWGIKISSKHRRLQLVSRLWSNTEDMDHITDSAYVVAKLVGIVEPGQAPKEMFGLNFTAHPPRRSFNSLKRSVISLL